MILIKEKVDYLCLKSNYLNNAVVEKNFKFYIFVLK